MKGEFFHLFHEKCEYGGKISHLLHAETLAETIG